MKAALALLTALSLHAQSSGTIEGRVTNSVTGQGVGGVKVRFLDRRSYVHDAVTDASGSYRVAGLDEGEYTAEFTRDGFSENSHNPFFHLAGDLQKDAQLVPWSSLRGRILDEDRNPVAGVRVEIDLARDGSTSTNPQGEFEFTGLAPGAYTLVAKPPPKTFIREGERLGAVAVYYPSATERSQAVPILVRSGQDVSGIELRLTNVPVHRLAGIVIDPAGKPAPHATVKLLDAASMPRAQQGFSFVMGDRKSMHREIAPGPEPEVAQAESREDGAFEFPAIESGDWRLTAVLHEYDDQPLAGVAAAFVSSKDVDGVRIQLSAPFAVGVSADWGDAKPAKYSERASNMLIFGPVEQQPRINVDPESNIGRINGLYPGRYHVAAMNLPPDSYAASVMWEGRDVMGQTVELSPGAGPFQVIYKSGMSAVTGSVENGAGCMVLLVPHDTAETITIDTATCGEDGSFAIDSVVPGDYYIAAFDGKNAPPIPWSALPVPIIPVATSLRVVSPSTGSVNLHLSQWPW